METKVISIFHPDVIKISLEILQSGGLIAFPTDTVYGVAAMVQNGEAVQKIYQAKERGDNKAIPILIGDQADLNLIASSVPENAAKLAAAYWPGALTLVIPKSPSLPEAVSAYPTVGVRMPDYEFALKLLKVSGPLAVTSANISGQENPLNAENVMVQLGGRIELILDGGPTPGLVPSTVVDCSTDQPIVLRSGAISEDLIRQALL
ncbi:MAG: threonylcarbamoyl-AMP synthase [Anaerolineaceae bacterium]|nr:threonylcarbamoyl-AMP synthase [Anaerolineaceae bacterium]